MQTLNLPSFTPKVSVKDGKYKIYDPLRRKNVALTSEEWVRQHFIHYLMEYKSYPPERIANEVGITLNGLSKRCDTIVYNRFIDPLMIVEYKAPSIAITEEAFNQIARYNMKLKVPYLIVSNGLVHYCCRLNYDSLSFAYLKEIPDYQQIEPIL
ncbi:type I restriction enzyme HsdR N-terminal domain-containing protein [Parabacteroides sp. Marseille-P3160]|uniref:type I restriction enzyme HsdR N-terminal domain-containing protein n=1 Tax=Parabacteroides sp. Marseille-P3160 TaxID=1917887 RepID=UPI0009B99A46|nr:type I restriction enzyme HsdR N-terminal domain-containing protein [Parabacteroides sp. Marseille-P3160]